MNTLIKAHIEKMNRLVGVSKERRTTELDFFTEASNKYRAFLNSPLAENPYKDKSLQEEAAQDFIKTAQNSMDGVIAKQTRLNINLKNMTQKEIKADKRFIANYFERLEKIAKLGGYLVAAIDPVRPNNLSTFIQNYGNININGTTERIKDRNMFMLAGWASLFNYFEDVKVVKDYYFKKVSAAEEIAILTQRILISITGETFKKYLHNKPYVIGDILTNKNLVKGEDKKVYYEIKGEVDSQQLNNNDILNLYLSRVPEHMNLQETFENAGITINATLQPQYFLGGSILTSTDEDVSQDTSIKIPVFSVNENKATRYFIKPIDTESINLTPAYKSEIVGHIAGLFSTASGNISVLSGYSNKRLGMDLPLGINEAITAGVEKLYYSLSPEGKAGFIGNRYALNTIGGRSSKKVSLVDAQKAYIMSIIQDHNLAVKLVQEAMPGGPSMVRETLTDETTQGRDIIKALNENNMPIPEFYKNMLGIKEWQAGMVLFYQKLPEEIKDLPEEQTEDVTTFVEQYS